MTSFKDLALSAPVMRAITDLGYTTPSPIQAAALPILLGEPTDFIGMASTGSGKTAAFALPMLERLDHRLGGVQALVLCPTRELAVQVAGQIDLLGKHKGISAVPVYGGTGYGEQISRLRRGTKVVVGTPGRLVDHLEKGTLDLQELKTIVLDEADEMISMGFKESLERILQSAPREQCNIWLFSATMSPEVRRVADAYLRAPQQVQVNREDMLPSSLEQIYYATRESNKPDVLCKLIDAADDFYGLVFCQTKTLVTGLTEYLQERGYRADCLHGDKSQAERDRAMNAFRERRVSLLVCTDVASRGLDVKDVTHVINYSLPRELELYVHRIGRTARSGKTGYALSLVTPSHRGLVDRIQRATKSTMSEGRIPSRKDIGMKKANQALGDFLATDELHEKASALLGEGWQAVIADMSKEEIVGRFIAMTLPALFSEQPPVAPAFTMPAGGDARGQSDEGRRPRHDARDGRFAGRPERFADDRGPRRPFPRRDLDDGAPRPFAREREFAPRAAMGDRDGASRGFKGTHDGAPRPFRGDRDAAPRPFKGEHGGAPRDFAREPRAAGNMAHPRPQGREFQGKAPFGPRAVADGKTRAPAGPRKGPAAMRPDGKKVPNWKSTGKGKVGRPATIPTH